MPKAEGIRDYWKIALCNLFPPSPHVIAPGTNPYEPLHVARPSLASPSARPLLPSVRGPFVAPTGSPVALRARPTAVSHPLQTVQPTRFQTLSQSIRDILDCGDRRYECINDGDCASTHRCIDNSCLPRAENCLVSGCGTGFQCNTQTGDCDDIENECSSDLQCEADKFCNLEIGRCRPVVGFCKSDSDCSDYTVAGMAFPACNLAINQCQQCKPLVPSICGNPAFGLADKPECSLSTNECVESCTPVPAFNVDPSAESRCCSPLDWGAPRVGPTRKESCCSASQNGVTEGPWSMSACYMTNGDTSRNCTLPWGGRTPDEFVYPNKQCISGTYCEWNGSSLDFGKCLPL